MSNLAQLWVWDTEEQNQHRHKADWEQKRYEEESSYLWAYSLQSN